MPLSSTVNAAAAPHLGPLARGDAIGYAGDEHIIRIEHRGDAVVVQECAALLDRLLRACPGLRILSTSRQPLGISGESTWRVSPLSLPSLQSTTSDAIAASDAVQLFCDRAKLALPTFALSESQLSTVGRICHRLDGLPLAIELAAARVPVLSLEQMLQRLDDRFQLLRGCKNTTSGFGLFRSSVLVT